MISKIFWQSKLDTTVNVLTSGEAVDLAEKYPAEPKYKDWVQVLTITEEAANVNG